MNGSKIKILLQTCLTNCCI